jgi:excisionase family DNA binding protein
MPADKRAFGPLDYQAIGQECYVAYVPARSRRVAESGPAEMLSPAQVAAELGVDERTVRRWIEAGVVPAERTTAGRYRVAPSVVPTLQRLGKDMPLNARTLRGRFEEGRTQPKAS